MNSGSAYRMMSLGVSLSANSAGMPHSFSICALAKRTGWSGWSASLATMASPVALSVRRRYSSLSASAARAASRSLTSRVTATTQRRPSASRP